MSRLQKPHSPVLASVFIVCAFAENDNFGNYSWHHHSNVSTGTLPSAEPRTLQDPYANPYHGNWYIYLVLQLLWSPCRATAVNKTRKHSESDVVKQTVGWCWCWCCWSSWGKMKVRGLSPKVPYCLYSHSCPVHSWWIWANSKLNIYWDATNRTTAKSKLEKITISIFFTWPPPTFAQ